MKCSRCGSTKVVKNESLSITICSNCGTVINDIEPLVNDLMINDNFGQGSSFTPKILLSSSYHSEKKLNSFLSSLIGNLKLPSYFAENSKRFYNICVNKNFLRGRSTLLVISTILYILTRVNKLGYLLIDFSDITKINLFSLGVCYLQMIKLLNIDIDVIDPSLFIKRFCTKITGVDTKKIAMTSLRVLQSMKKSWLSEGRNPSGLCGAAIYISLCLNGYNFTPETICDIVQISEQTLIKRVNEFKETSFAKLTKEEFEMVNFDTMCHDDPPSFIKNRLEEKLRLSENTEGKKQEKLNEKEYGSDSDNIGMNLTKCESQITNNQTSNGEGELFLDAMALLSEKKEREFIQDEPPRKEEDDITLSELNDSECDEYIANNEEYEVKKALWEEMNKDWIKKEKKSPTGMKRKRSHLIVNKKYENAKDAILHNSKFLKMRMKKKISFIKNINNIINRTQVKR